MEQKLKNFRIKFNKKIPVDELLERALYDPNSGYYNNRIPFGKKGDFITSPTISNLFSEIMGICKYSTFANDGMILTPNGSVSGKGTADSGADNKVYKWKSEEQTTIDFKIKVNQ